MGLIDYMILSERFQGIRCDCIRLTLVDALILIKSLVPIALIYLFGIKLFIAFSYPVFCALFLYFYLKREEQVLSAIFDETDVGCRRRPVSR